MTAIWLTDSDGNKCSIEYFGSKAEAQTALDSLRNCRNCVNCSGCSGCSRCSGLYLQNNMKAVAPGEANAGPPPIPVIENIHKTIYAAASNPKSLDMANVHTCDNTHCRGGWAITLAGEAGMALEKFYNWELAAMLIYDVSAPGFKINPARFYDTNEAALADMKKLADEVVP